MIYNPILSSEPLTVLSELKPTENLRTSYQSEEQLEKEFIKQLQSLSYEYLPLKTKEDLKNNLRVQLEKLNSFKFTDEDWENFYKKEIVNPQKGITEKIKLVQDNKSIIDFECVNKTRVNIKLLDKDDFAKNTLQVINQYEVSTSRYKNRYDVTLLVNGLPLVHIELKRRGIRLREAFNQINRYGRESFWINDSLFEYIQLFIISNGTDTRYYSNTTRLSKVEGNNKKITNVTWKNTCNWTDSKNVLIKDLTDFTNAFLRRRTLLNIIFNYCVFNTKEQLMVMRPYQICAAEKILSKVNISFKNNLFGKRDAGGYIWHTTGSGKTLTSFKTAQLLSTHPDIKKVFFIVDRRDLDYQTIQEYNKFEKGCVVENKTTKELEKQILSDKKIVVTTIQKMISFLKNNKKHSIFNEKVIMIFDECHRSQFGNMHTQIVNKFKQNIMFGFTGTPILAENANSLQTTESTFGKCLHTYTIQNAINDEKVLPFRIQYYRTMKMNDDIEDEEVVGIDTDSALLADERIDGIVKYIEKSYNRVTSNKKFNSILACQSVEAAKKYYLRLKDKFRVATIYSYKANEEINDDGLDEEELDNTDLLEKSSKDFLNDAIDDYNKLFNTSFNTGDQFQAYYKDLSKRVKDKDIDILIVVNMFLTGFDAPKVNTLWVDKNLKYHGLIQAFSRTNRTLSDLKPYGNIICFRPLEENVNKAIKLFGNKDAIGIVTIESFDVVNSEYVKIVDDFKRNFHTSKNVQFIGNTQRRLFIKLFSKILSKRNILSSFEEFDPLDTFTEFEFNDYMSVYVNERDRFIRLNASEKRDILDDIVFEMEILKNIDIDVDEIIRLVSEKINEGTDVAVIKDYIMNKVNASLVLRSKKELIEEFLNNTDPDISNFNVEEEWLRIFESNKEKDLLEIVTSENLNIEKLNNFLESCVKNNELNISGDAIIQLFNDRIGRFGKNVIPHEKTEKKHRVENKLRDYFEKYFM